LTVAALIFGAAPALAQSEQPAAKPEAAKPLPIAPQTAVVVDENFVLGVGDAINVRVVGRSDFDGTAVVSSEGVVVLPLIGKIKALGVTTGALSQQIRSALKDGGFFADPVVSIQVVNIASRYATILGDVTSPGLLPLDRDYRLSEIVARVGGRAGEGAGTIILTRANGQSTKYTIADIATGAGNGDPIIEPGDKIYVPPAAAEVFYISGQVKNPGSFPVTTGMTVREAIARGGGVTEMGSVKKVKLFRNNERIKGAKLETELQPGDIVEIGERLF